MSSYNIKSFRPPNQSNTAILIPCLNEGTRLINQVRKINERYTEKFDLVIVDGGSWDNSIHQLMNEDFQIMQSIISAKQTTSLSHDLHFALNFLSKNYDAIITLDGNGKDDVTCIGSLLEYALINKVDFIQGSRFRKGGRSENLPLDRWIGIKFFISPIVSIAARKHLTDPSNQFRFYSSKIFKELKETNIDSFKRYDYFFYLPIVISKRGFVVKEYPVARMYPRSGPTPTHIKRSRYFRLGLDLIRISLFWRSM